MKKYIYYLPHIVTLAGLGFAVMALFSILENNFPWAARYSLLVLLVDRIDGTLARGLKVKEKLPGISGEILDIITDLVGLTFVPMVLFWKIGLFVENFGLPLAVASTMAASWKYARKESFLVRGYSVGAPPIFFSLFLFYFLSLPGVYATIYATVLIALVISPVKYPITSLVTTHWKPGYKSITNYLTAIFFVPVFILLENAPAPIYWVMLSVILVQLFIYPLLLNRGILKPVFDRQY
jgi:phosphatidylcholine synthase